MLIGAKCSCGEWVAPAYVYHKSKIDKKIIDFWIEYQLYPKMLLVMLFPATYAL